MCVSLHRLSTVNRMPCVFLLFMLPAWKCFPQSSLPIHISPFCLFVCFNYNLLQIAKAGHLTAWWSVSYTWKHTLTILSPILWCLCFCDFCFLLQILLFDLPLSIYLSFDRNTRIFFWGTKPCLTLRFVCSSSVGCEEEIEICLMNV